MILTKEHLLALKPCDLSRVEAWAKRHPNGQDLGDSRLLAGEVQADDTGLVWFAGKMGFLGSTSLGAAAYLHQRAYAGTLELPAPKPRTHTLGGLVFEETGEMRQAKAGEWYVDALGIAGAKGDTCGSYPILRPVRVERPWEPQVGDVVTYFVTPGKVGASFPATIQALYDRQRQVKYTGGGCDSIDTMKRFAAGGRLRVVRGGVEIVSPG